MTNEELDTLARGLVSDLHEPRPILFWADTIGTAVAAWSSFALGLAARPLSPGMFAALSIAVIALYRGVCFVHELTHIRRRALPGLETAWNLLFGVPLLLPSFTYMGVHQSHHNLSTYGTKDDPEYLPLASSKRLMVVFAVQSTFLVPVLLAVRFLVLAPVGLAWPRFHRWLEVHATSFAMNPDSPLGTWNPGWLGGADRGRVQRIGSSPILCCLVCGARRDQPLEHRARTGRARIRKRWQPAKPSRAVE